MDPLGREHGDDESIGSKRSSAMASVENFSRVLNVELHGVGREERFDLTILNETKQVKVRAVPQRLSIWNVCQWKGVAQEHAFEVGVLEALRANRCFVAMVRAESEALDEIVEDCSSTGHVICLAEEGGMVPQADELHVLFFPYDTSGFREVYFFMHAKIPTTHINQVFQGFLVVGQKLLPQHFYDPNAADEAVNGGGAAMASSPPPRAMSTSPSHHAPAVAQADAATDVKREEGGGSWGDAVAGGGSHRQPAVKEEGECRGRSRSRSPGRRFNDRNFNDRPHDRNFNDRNFNDRNFNDRRRSPPRRRPRSRSPGFRNGGGNSFFDRQRYGSSPGRSRGGGGGGGGGNFSIQRGKKSCCWGGKCYGKPEGTGKCIHLHPGDPGYEPTKECNFGNDCKKRKEKSCIFLHPDEMGRAGASAWDPKLMCRFGATCREYRDGKCSKLHPNQSGGGGGGGGSRRSRSRSRDRSRDRSRRSRSRSCSSSGSDRSSKRRR